MKGLPELARRQVNGIAGIGRTLRGDAAGQLSGELLEPGRIEPFDALFEMPVPNMYVVHLGDRTIGILALRRLEITISRFAPR